MVTCLQLRQVPEPADTVQKFPALVYDKCKK